MSATVIFLAAAVLIAITNWASLQLKLKGWDAVSKPAVIVALMFSTAMDPTHSSLHAGMIIGLSFSFAGDVFLRMKERLFLAGLISFSLAHAAYILAFNPSPPPASSLTLIFAAGTLMVSSWIFAVIYRAQKSPTRAANLIPLIMYTLLITGTLFSGLTTLLRPEWKRTSALLIASGVSFFYVSDGLLAWHRYISPLEHRDLKVRIPYHVGQICLVAGTLLSELP